MHLFPKCVKDVCKFYSRKKVVIEGKTEAKRCRERKKIAVLNDLYGGEPYRKLKKRVQDRSACRRQFYPRTDTCRESESGGGD